MGRPRIFALFALCVCQSFAVAMAIGQEAPANALLDPRSAPAAQAAPGMPGMATLKICLRLEDETPFMGVASVRVSPEEGNELLGMPGDAQGEYMFAGISSGKYKVEILAPGFPGVLLTTKIDGGPRQKTLYVPMRQNVVAAPGTDAAASLNAKLVTEGEAEPKPDSKPAGNADANSQAEKPAGVHDGKEDSSGDAIYAGNDLLSSGSTPMAPANGGGAGHTAGKPTARREAPAKNPAAKSLLAPAKAGPAGPDYWSAHELEEVIPSVDPAIACPTDQLLKGVGKRMAEFVETLERFTAIEKLEHYPVTKDGERKAPETRSFPYVVSVKQNMLGTFLLEEYRNGTTDADQFPAHTATRGSPAMALIFHPILAPGFEFKCEGMGVRDGHQTWLVHFVQRNDRPVQIRSYSVNGRTYPVYLEGRVWIDPGNDQIVHMETELARPVKEIELTREHFVIDYKPVEFRSTGQQLWLPQTAELYVERKNKRFYRRHLFSDFRLFNVDAAQNIKPPSESFSFTNTSDHDVTGELTVSFRDGMSGEPVILRFVVPAHGKVFKVVGPGKDIDMKVANVGAATFTHEGASDAVKVDSHLLTETSLDVVPQSNLQHPSP